MRDRQPNDWVMDLAGRHDLEAQVAAAIESHPGLKLLENTTDRFDKLDYTVSTRQVHTASLELKAKWQPYRGWQRHRPDIDQIDLFILDELALRRIMASAPHSYLLNYDHPQKRWVLYGAADLLLAPKGRVARRINRQRSTMKGKVLIDLGDGHQSATLDHALDVLAATINDTNQRWHQVEPWPIPNKGAAVL